MAQSTALQTLHAHAKHTRTYKRDLARTPISVPIARLIEEFIGSLLIQKWAHRELLHTNGVYAKLWSHQSGGFIEE
jgi:hypothetical protein